MGQGGTPTSPVGNVDWLSNWIVGIIYDIKIIIIVVLFTCDMWACNSVVDIFFMFTLGCWSIE